MVAFSSRMSGLAGRLRPLPGRACVAGFRHSPAGRAVQWVHRRVSAVNKAGGLKPRAERGTAFARVALLCRGVLWHFPS